MNSTEFRKQLDSLQGLDSAARLRTLCSIAKEDLDYVQTLTLDRAMDSISKADAKAYIDIRLAICGSSTMNHLMPAIRVAGLRRGLFIHGHIGNFGQYRQEMLDINSATHGFAPDIVLLAPTAADVIGGIALLVDRATADESVDASIAELRSLWRTVKERMRATVIQQGIIDSTYPLFGSHERLIPGAPRRLISLANYRLSEAALEDDVRWLDIPAAIAHDGLDKWFDVRNWFQAKVEIAPPAAKDYGELVARLIAAEFGLSKKCLVMDLDNTLWGGVVGDDGVDGIVLGEGSAVGEAHLALQKYARLLKERGVILAVCSKNEWDTVSEVFDTHPEMHLKKSDIAAFAVDWEDKALNIEKLSKQLNIGLDSMVFIDDNPAERARVRGTLPMVAVPELPEDPSYYVQAVAAEGYFEAINITNEDIQRTKLYRANTERRAFEASATSIDEFLSELEMAMRFDSLRSVDLSRASQLINKTNQFNTTTRRVTTDALSDWSSDERSMILVFRLGDKFGDHGLVSVMVFRPHSLESDTLELTSWVMSCRVFGRQLESAAMNVAVELAKSRGMERFLADYIPTPKNAVIKALFENLGFTKVEQSPDGTSRWSLKLTDYDPAHTHIKRDSPHE